MSAVFWFLWLQFCFLCAVLSVFYSMLLKTHAKAVQTANRANLIAPVAKAANQASTTATSAQTTANSLSTSLGAIVTAGNASFLAGLSPIGGLSSWPTFGGSPTLAELTTDVQNGVSVVNEIIANMASNGFT